MLVIEDEPGVRSALSNALRLEGYVVDTAKSREEALEALATSRFDLVILADVMKNWDGLRVCRALREIGDGTPVLMLSARGSVDDRVAGLDAGADDCLMKPFDVKEAKARLRALLRRRDGHIGLPFLRFRDLELNRNTYEAWRGHQRLELSRTEFQLLEFFMRHPRQVLDRGTIFERVWGYDFGATSNSIGVYIGYLRRKTEAGGAPRLLHTVRGVGYVLRDDPALLPAGRERSEPG